MEYAPWGHLYSKVDIMLEYKTQKKGGFQGEACTVFRVSKTAKSRKRVCF